MLTRLLIAAAARGLAATAAVAAPQGAPMRAPLPDFPLEARSGECWSRLPAGPIASGGQAVWTLQRGTGPTAIWSLSQAASGPAPLGTGPLTWAQVDCVNGRPFRFAQAAPPPMAFAPPPPEVAPPPPPPAPRFGPYADVEPAPQYAPPMAHARPEPRFAPPAAHQPHAPQFMPPMAHARPGPEFAPPPMVHAPGYAPPPFSGHGPYADARPMEPAFHAPPPFPAPHAFGPPLPFAHPVRAERQPVAPWFGGRYLTWPGKTGR